MTFRFHRPLAALVVAFALFATPALGQISVSTPEVTCGASESVTVPVEVSELTGQGAFAFSFRLQYDNSKIAITGADQDNTLSASYTLLANPKSDEILVSAASATAFTGSGTLVNLTVECNAEGTSPLTFSEFAFNEGQPSASTSNGVVNVGEGGEVQIGIQINPGDVDFGSLEVGATTTETITIANPASSGAALTGEIALVQSGDAFSIVSGGGEFALGVGESQEVVVSFAPGAEGDYAADLEVTHNATTQAGPASIGLAGAATAAAAPSVMISEMAIDLGDVIVFREESASVTIQNTGNAALSGSVALAGADAEAFAITAGAGDFTIAAGGSLEITVAFAPETPGDKVAELHVTHDAQNVSSPAIVSLEGTALANVAAERNEVPGDFRLAQNYPNPFNPQTTLEFGLPNSGHVRLSVFDLAGRELDVLVDSVMPAGWHAVDFDARALPSGTYLYHMQTESMTLTRKMTVLK